VRRMREENPLWGAPRIHGELLKLGFTVAQSTVSKYMLRGRRPPSQGWKTFLRNHADGIAAVDFLVVPTLTFESLFAFVILGVGRRNILWIGVTTNPTAQWLAHQISEAFPWDMAPTFLIRDNDCAYSAVFTQRVRSMGIRDRPIAPRSPWQNGYIERAIGSIRRECPDELESRGHSRAVKSWRLEFLLMALSGSQLPPRDTSDIRLEGKQKQSRHRRYLPAVGVCGTGNEPGRPRSGFASSGEPYSVPSPTSLWGWPPYCWRFYLLAFWHYGTCATRRLRPDEP
jgi:transposase InsO family protein